MANKTDNLKLVKPELGEFRDSWQTPHNANMDAIDGAVTATSDEVLAARGSASSLSVRLAVALENSGAPKATPEVVLSRNSFLYGHLNGSVAWSLNSLQKKRDKELWRLRQAQPNFRLGIGYGDSFSQNKILSGSKSILGYPAWGGFLADKVQVSGAAAPLFMSIAGVVSRIRKLKEIPIVGAAGTYFVYAERTEDGVVVTSNALSSTTLDSATEHRVLKTIGVDFGAIGVVAGDFIRIASPVGIAEDYVIESVGTVGSSTQDQVTIVGLFPGNPLGSVSYQIFDPLDVTLSSATTRTDSPTRVYLGECDFDGTAVTAFRPYSFGDTFVGEWRSVDVSVTPFTFEQEWNHGAGVDTVDIVVQASIANDGSQPVEVLSTNGVVSSLTLGLTAGSLAVSSNISALTATPALGSLSTQNASQTAGAATDFAAHNHTVTGAPSVTLGGSIANTVAGSPSGTLGGAVEALNAVKMKCTRTKVSVKNAHASRFFTDYSGATRTSGFIRVIVTKRK
jgi:hypothetical protein